MSLSGEEKTAHGKPVIQPATPDSVHDGEVVSDNQSDKREVFDAGVDGVDFRTITWQRLIIILLKVQVATGVLSIPSALGSLGAVPGAVPGAICIVGWQALNTCQSSVHLPPMHADRRLYPQTRHAS